MMRGCGVTTCSASLRSPGIAATALPTALGDRSMTGPGPERSETLVSPPLPSGSFTPSAPHREVRDTQPRRGRRQLFRMTAAAFVVPGATLLVIIIGGAFFLSAFTANLVEPLWRASLV